MTNMRGKRADRLVSMYQYMNQHFERHIQINSMNGNFMMKNGFAYNNSPFFAMYAINVIFLFYYLLKHIIFDDFNDAHRSIAALLLLLLLQFVNFPLGRWNAAQYWNIANDWFLNCVTRYTHTHSLASNVEWSIKHTIDIPK